MRTTQCRLNEHTHARTHAHTLTASPYGKQFAQQKEKQIVGMAFEEAQSLK